MFGKRNRGIADVPPPRREAAAAPETPTTPRAASKGQQAYEARRAEKAGVGLEKWMADKERRTQAEREAERRARQKAPPQKKPGLLRRLLDRAHKPL